MWFILGSLQIDHSIVESFAGGGKTCITSRVYPTLAIGEEARLFAFNNGTESVVITNLSAWSVKKARTNIEETIACEQDDADGSWYGKMNSGR